MKYLIASHGKYASALYSEIILLTGESKEIYTIDAYLDNEPFQDKFNRIVNLNEDCRWIIFTDLLGGSVNQFMMKNCHDERFKIIAGVNLYSILEILELEENDELDRNIKHVLNESTKQMAFVSELIKKEVKKNQNKNRY